MDNFSQGLSREASRNISQDNNSELFASGKGVDMGDSLAAYRNIGIYLPPGSMKPFSNNDQEKPVQNKNGHHVPEATSAEKPQSKNGHHIPEPGSHERPHNKDGHHTPEASNRDQPRQNKNGHHTPEASSHDRPHNKNGHHDHGRDIFDRQNPLAELQILAVREMERRVQQEMMMMKMMERQMVKDGILPPCQLFDDSSSEGQQLASRNSQKKESELGNLVKTGVKAAISMLI